MSLIRAQATFVRAGAPDSVDRAESVTATRLQERYMEAVFRYVLRRVPRIEEAEDITAEVFAAAFVGLSRFRGDGSPYLWLLGIARRKIADALRRQAARRETLSSELAEAEAPLQAALAGAASPEAALVWAEARAVVRDLVAQLSADQREAVLLQYMERLTVPEIAVVMRRSPTSVKGLLQRARATLHRQGKAYFLSDDEERDR